MLKILVPHFLSMMSCHSRFEPRTGNKDKKGGGHHAQSQQQSSSEVTDSSAQSSTDTAGSAPSHQPPPVNGSALASAASSAITKKVRSPLFPRKEPVHFTLDITDKVAVKSSGPRFAQLLQESEADSIVTLPSGPSQENNQSNQAFPLCSHLFVFSFSQPVIALTTKSNT